MSYISSRSLTIFIATQFINIGGLITDYIAKANNLPEITAISVKYPVVGISLVILEFASPITLALHFWYHKYPEEQ